MIGRLFIADVKMIVRNKQALFWALMFPILFATIFGLFRFDDIGEASVAVYGERGATTEPVRQAINEAPALNLESEHASVEEARDALANDEVSFVLFVASDGDVQVAFNEATADRNAVFIPVIMAAIDELNIRVSGVPRAFRVETTGVSGVKLEYYDFVLPGLVGMAVMTYGIIGIAGTIAQYRGQQILKRIRATPLRPSTFITAIVLAHLVLALVQSGLVLLWGTQLFGGTVRGSLLWVFVFVLLGNMTFLNIGFMVATRVESAEAASGLGNAIAMPMMFFSGVFFPTAGLPWILPELTSILPLSPMVDAIRDVSLSGASITSLGSEFGQLLAWAVVTFAIAARMFRFERA